MVLRRTLICQLSRGSPGFWSNFHITNQNCSNGYCKSEKITGTLSLFWVLLFVRHKPSYVTCWPVTRGDPRSRQWNSWRKQRATTTHVDWKLAVNMARLASAEVYKPAWMAMLQTPVCSWFESNATEGKLDTFSLSNGNPRLVHKDGEWIDVKSLWNQYWRDKPLKYVGVRALPRVLLTASFNMPWLQHLSSTPSADSPHELFLHHHFTRSIVVLTRHDIVLCFHRELLALKTNHDWCRTKQNGAYPFLSTG